MNIVTNIIDRYLKKSMEFFDTKLKDYVIDKHNRDYNFIRKELQKYLNKCTKNYYVKSLLYKEKGQLITNVYVNIPLKNYEDEEKVTILVE